MADTEKPEPEVVPALRDHIAQRMTEVGIYGPTALATAAGITVQGLLPLRRGVRKNVQRRPTAPVGRALGWTPDSIDLILDGAASR